MLPIHTIIHPTDFSDRSAHAFRLACALARDYRARLIVLHVWWPHTAAFGELGPMLQPDEGYDLTETKQKLHRLQPPDSAVGVEHRLEEGDPATAILGLAEAVKADLIVMGTHGRTGLSRLLMGSVAEKVVRRAECPVVTVKTSFPNVEPPVNAAVKAVVKEPLEEMVKG